MRLIKQTIRKIRTDENKRDEEYQKVIKIIEGAYIGGIKIDDKNIAFTSNSALPNGDNKLIIYKIESDSIIKERLHEKNSKDILNQCQHYVDKFSDLGFRTLFIAVKILSQEYEK